MKGIWYNLKKVKFALKSLNRKEFACTTSKVQQLRETLASIQAQMRTTTTPTDMFDTEKITKQQLEKCSKIEESIYKQRSRVQWLKLGDSNTAFFFASMKVRAAQNQIKLLTADDGRLIKTPEGIEQEEVGFYRGLLGRSTNSIPAINPSIMRKGPGITRSQQLQLISLFTKEDMVQALQGI
ncbi:uncharacterized protein [Nicotiana sylvestris]|uniref:uncharacterized protein n=1 Tax=Nicotiana sylvestris TaxID=4096 RepID=UPI00388C3FD3